MMKRNLIVEQDLASVNSLPLPWERLAGKVVMVAGAYGFLPAYVVETLLFRNEQDASFGVKIVGLCRSPDKARRRFAFYEGRDDLEFIFQDVCDPVTYRGKIDYIIHAASWASPRFYGRDPVGTLMPNVLGTRNLLELARLKEVSGFLFMSSAEIYGLAGEEHIPTGEDYCGCVDPTNVRSCYAEAKRMGETMCVAWHHQYGVPAVIARIFHTYGPGMALDDGRVFADFVADVVAGRDIHLRSSGTARRAFCYLTDFVHGILAILLKGTPGLPYNLGNDEAEISVRELAAMLARLYAERGIGVVKAREEREGYIPTRVERACPDTSRLRALGWRPKVGLEEGFRRTVASFMD